MQRPPCVAQPHGKFPGSLKAFAAGGEDFAYYLNESRTVARSGLGAAAAAGENWADSSPL